MVRQKTQEWQARLGRDDIAVASFSGLTSALVQASLDYEFKTDQTLFTHPEELRRHRYQLCLRTLDPIQAGEDAMLTRGRTGPLNVEGWPSGTGAPYIWYPMVLVPIHPPHG